MLDYLVLFTVPAELFNNVSGDQSVPESSDLQLYCGASGNPAPNITWVKAFNNGSKSQPLYRNPTWNISNIKRTDAGIYRCKANNGVGNPVSHTLMVNVLCKSGFLSLNFSIVIHSTIIIAENIFSCSYICYRWLSKINISAKRPVSFKKHDKTIVAIGYDYKGSLYTAEFVTLTLSFTKNWKLESPINNPMEGTVNGLTVTIKDCMRLPKIEPPSLHSMGMYNCSIAYIEIRAWKRNNE